MLEEIKNIRTGDIQIKSFGKTIAIIFFVIAFLLFNKESEYYKLVIYIGLFFVSCGFLAPKILKPIYFVWMTFAIIFGWFMTRLILSLLFFLIVTPTGLLLKIIKKDLLELNKQESQGSYWNLRDSKNERNQNYEKQF